ncbi:MAG: S9 family peptidase [Parvularculaceae bacterium]
MQWDAAPEAFGRLPQVSDLNISPNGWRLAFLRGDGERPSVIVHNLRPGADPPKKYDARDKDEKIRGLRWVNDHQIVITISRTEYFRFARSSYEIFRLLLLDVDSGDMQYLMSGGRFGLSTGRPAILHLLPDDPEHILVAHLDVPAINMRNPYGKYNAFKLNLENGRAKRVAAANEHTVGWRANADGEIVVRIDYDANREVRSIFVRDSANDNCRELFSVNEALGDFAEFGVSTIDDSGQYLYVTTRNDSGRYAFARYSMETGELHDYVFERPDVDVGGGVIDSYSRRLIGVSYTDDIGRIEYFDKSEKDLHNSLRQSFQNLSVASVSVSRDRQRRVLRVSGPSSPARYYLYDAENGSAALLASAYPEIDAKKLGHVAKFDYDARDGLRIPAYLTTPPNAEPAGLPLIVLPHGGPSSRDTMAFDWWSQFYAARGYAVLRPNFRGSSGYGEEFLRAGDREWGRKMQDDVSDGVLAAVNAGIADPERVCIVGASYGGYAALAGATLSPELYACAVSFAGISDLILMLIDERDNEAAFEFWSERIGKQFERDHLRSISPRFQVDNIRAPILLIHGRDDSVAPIVQSDVFYRAASDAGKQIDYVKFDSEDHWLSNGATRTRLLEESIKFIDRRIGSN